jgi:DNA-binding transcriptional ArsR family regulator
MSSASSPEPAGGQSSLKPGEVFAGRYAIDRELGHGGFGVVYAAFDQGPLQRAVALKVIRFQSGEASERAERAKLRFLEEARLAAGLSHTNIATVFDAGEYAGCVHMTQELVPGRDLQRLLAEKGPLPVRRVIAITKQICDGLAHAHANGIVHRDIKPGNIMVDAEDRVKITDFGLAQPLHDEDSTLSGVIAGTPGYMAPEQLRDERVDPRADIFAVGCVLYQMLTGRRPFEGATPASVIEKTLYACPPSPSRVRDDLPRSLDRIVSHAMAKKPDERYNSAILLAQDLVNYEQFEYLMDQKQGADEVAASLDAARCVLFLGLCLPVGPQDERSPTADSLITEYFAERLHTTSKERNLPRLAQDLEMEVGRSEMLRHLAAVVRIPGVSPREIIRRVARLPFHVIVTTQYDTYLEEELSKANRNPRRILDYRKVPDELGDRDLVVRLFGSVESEETIIVTEDDLWNFFAAFDLISDALKSLLARQPLLFVGYDPQDEGFRHLLSEIARYRAGINGACYLPAGNVSLPSVRWAERKGLHLIDSEPGPFLTLLEETIVVKRRQEKSRLPEPVLRARVPERPYKFLNYFDVDDEAIFFGRQHEAQKLLSKIHAYTLNVLYAPSGSGKTSLICAGLIPALLRDGYSPVLTRVYDDPEGEIRTATIRAAGAAYKEMAANVPLPTLLSQLAARAGRPLVVFVDQFEEIFIRHDRPARDRFAASLQAVLAEAKGQVRFVISLREDFLPRLSEFQDRIPTIFHNEFRLAPLSAEASHAAIIEPAQLLGIAVEPALVDRLLADLSTEAVDPPQLQIVCDTLYDALPPGSKTMTLQSYLSLGETRKILTNYLERVIRELASQDRDTAREILKNLVTSERTKTVCRISDLGHIVGRPEEEISRILADLSNRRLIRRVQREEGFWYELTHEYLVEEISRWLSEKEKELKKIRELLEQVLRNFRSLGIPMSQAQIRLIAEHEDDLAMSKEERQFLRVSQKAISMKRRNLTIAAIAAVTLFLLTAATWRYVYLRSHVFIHPQDSEFIEFNRGKKESHRIESIRVYAGSPTRSWFDAWLRFPKPLYETEFELEQIDPTRRDAIKKGLMFQRHASIEDEIFEMLKPEEKALHLIAVGKLEEVIKLIPALYKEPSTDKDRLDAIVGMLGYSQLRNANFVRETVSRALLTPTHETGMSDQSDKLYLSGLLGQLPEAGWREGLTAFLKIPTTRRDALELLGLLGNKSDASLIAPYLDDRSGTQIMGSIPAAALRALNNVGDCSVPLRVRKLLRDPQADHSVLNEGIKYIRYCGNQADLGLMEEVSDRQAASGVFGGFEAQETIKSMYEMSGHTSLPNIRRSLSLGGPADWKVEVLGNIFDPETDSDLLRLLKDSPSSIKARAATLLARRGETSGLVVAAGIALDPGESISTRAQALYPFEWFSGPNLRDFLLRLLKTSKPEQAEMRVADYGGLRWYDDDETLSALLDGFKDRDASVREAALMSFTFEDSERRRQRLREAVGAHDPLLRVYAARSLQLLHLGDFGDVFRRFLQEAAEQTKDYPALVAATVGLRDSFLDKPPSVAVGALRDPRRETRLAALLALTQHPDMAGVTEALQHAANDNDRRFWEFAQRARWAIGVAQKAEQVRESTRVALLESDNRCALRDLSRVYSEYNFGQGSDYVSVLKLGLSEEKSGAEMPFKHFYLFEKAFSPRLDRFKLVQSEALLRRVSLAAAMDYLESMVLENASLGRSIREDVDFEPLHKLYEFRVLTGLQKPISIKGIKLPEIEGTLERKSD